MAAPALYIMVSAVGSSWDTLVFVRHTVHVDVWFIICTYSTYSTGQWSPHVAVTNDTIIQPLASPLATGGMRDTALEIIPPPRRIVRTEIKKYSKCVIKQYKLVLFPANAIVCLISSVHADTCSDWTQMINSTRFTYIIVPPLLNYFRLSAIAPPPR